MFFLMQFIARIGVELSRKLCEGVQGRPALRITAAAVFAKLKVVAPYAAMELLLPGGSIIALTAWFLRRRKRAPALVSKLS
jgi:hypothetical protein